MRRGGSYVTCGINISKFSVTLFFKLETVDPVVYGHIFRDIQVLYYVFFSNFENDIKRLT